VEPSAATTEEDYPRNFLEFQERFGTEEACRTYLEQLRWPEGFRCPGCGGDRAWRMGRGLLLCSKCRRQTSVTAGTIFQDTRKPLRLWFLVMWHVTSEKGGVSAQSLQRLLGFTRYETVWVWLHKLRRAMVRPGRDRLFGEVEVDETYVGGEEPGVSGRETQTKSIVAVAAEARGRAIGRIRLRIVADISADSLVGFVEEAVAPGSLVVTDGLSSYSALEAKGYRHKVTQIKGSGRQAPDLLPRVHRVAALLKRWLLGTHQGSVRAYYLDYYLDEFTFRFNRRTSRQRGKLFYRLVQQALLVDHVPRQEL
jgi:transposase-like protein/ribosomal protein L37AE/L43A